MPILELKDICKDYQQGREPVRVLKNINLTVEKGDYLAIMGPSGSGKTTLMNIIGCLDVPTSGSYILEGRDLKDLSDDDLAEVRNKHIGFVFQSFHLLPKMEAVDNVALPLLYADVPLKERRARAEEALKAVGLGSGFTSFPTSFPADSASGWPSPGPSWEIPSCCWRTSPPARWIPRRAIRSWRFSAVSAARA